MVANTALVMMIFADYLKSTDPNNSGTRQYNSNTRQKELFDYAVNQVNYILGDGGT